MGPRFLCVTLLVFSTCHLACGRAIPARPALQSVGMRPAATPGEAIDRSVAAAANADEVAFRGITLIQSPYGYSDGCMRWALASQRLHQAIRRYGVTSKRVRAAGFDRNEKLANAGDEITKDDVEKDRRLRQRVKWTIEGDVALANGERSSTTTAGVQTVERSGAGWIVALRDPEVAPTGDPSAARMTRLGQGWATLAAAMDAAADEIKAGRLKTILEVNDFVKAESKELANQNPALNVPGDGP